MSDQTPRPSQTTMNAGIVMGGSALVVVTVGERLAAINSLETRQAVTEFLAASPGTGLDVPAALVLLRTALMVVAGCATAAGVLAFHVLRRSRSARLGLTIIAVPLLFLGLATGGFLTSLVAMSSWLLWIEPSRAWLDRRPLPEPATRTGRTGPADRPPVTPPGPPAPPAAGPPPHTGEYGAPAPPPPYPPLPDVVPDRRPSGVLWACVLTWGFTALTVALLAGSLTLLVADPSVIWAELERQNPGLLADSGLSRDDVLRTTYVTLGAGIVWSLVAAGLAVLVHRRHNGGRIGLMVCAGVAGLICFVGSFGAALLLVPAMACAATLGLLVRADVRAWFGTARRVP